MMILRQLIAFAGGGLLVAETALAQITVVDDNRSWAASVRVDEYTNVSGPPFFIFKDTLTNAQGGSQSTGGAYIDGQQLVHLPQITASGFNAGAGQSTSGVGMVPPGGFFNILNANATTGTSAWPFPGISSKTWADASTTYDVTFTLGSAYTFQFDLGADLTRETNAIGSAEAFLYSVSTGTYVDGTHFLLDSVASTGTDVTGLLEAGDYRMYANITAHAESASPAFNGVFSSTTGGELRFHLDLTPAVSPVPEPETYAMLLAGLGLLGWQARRSKQVQCAA